MSIRIMEPIMTKVNNMIEHTIHYEDDRKRQMAVLDEKISESRKKLSSISWTDVTREAKKVLGVPGYW